MKSINLKGKTIVIQKGLSLMNDKNDRPNNNNLISKNIIKSKDSESKFRNWFLTINYKNNEDSYE